MSCYKNIKKYLVYLATILFILISIYFIVFKKSKDISELSVTFYPVSKGDCIILECEGESLLIDSGYIENTEDILKYLSKQNITNLSAAIATHPHKDHIGGMAGIISSGIDIGVLYKTNVDNDSVEYSSMISAIETHNITTKNPEFGSSFYLGSAKVTFVSPFTEYTDYQYDSINNTSIVTKVEYAGKTMLFTGDILTKVEKDLLALNLDLSADILKVAHHGLSDSSSKKFIEAVNPKYAVITCDEENVIAPSDEVLNRLNKPITTILRTDTDGLINISIDAYGVIKRSQKR